MVWDKECRLTKRLEIEPKHTRTIVNAGSDWGDWDCFHMSVFYLGDWLQTRAVVNDLWKLHVMSGDDWSDPNCSTFHQYYPEINTASQPTWLPKQESLLGVVHGKMSIIYQYFCSHTIGLCDNIPQLQLRNIQVIFPNFHDHVCCKNCV